MLVGSHPTGNTVHDDAYFNFFHKIAALEKVSSFNTPVQRDQKEISEIIKKEDINFIVVSKNFDTQSTFNVRAQFFESWQLNTRR